MTEEEIKALQDARDAAEQKAAEAVAAAEAAKADADKARGDVTKIVDELKEERRKKQEALDGANINNETPDVNSLVELALQKKEKERADRELEEAITEFKNSKPEFQSDTAGVVFDKFKQGLTRFSFADVKTKEQAKQRLDEAYRFLNTTQPNQEPSTYEGSPASGYPVPNRDGEMPRENRGAMEMAKIDEEKFTKLKGKYSEAFQGLGIE